MSEMLANYYYMIQNFILAEQLYSELLVKEKHNYQIKKKLIYCLLYNGKIKTALNTFSELVRCKKEFLQLIIKEEECICNNIINDLETKRNIYISFGDTLLIQAITSAFQNGSKSLKYFSEFLILDKSNKTVKKIISALQQINNKSRGNRNAKEIKQKRIFT